MPSFSVRCVFRWAPRHDQKLRNLYEERITLWQADGFEDAIALAEKEAQEYASDGEECLAFAQAYELYDDIACHGVEVYSLVRESDLEPSEYLSAFFDTGRERSQ
jgi:hypothetical protein